MKITLTLTDGSVATYNKYGKMLESHGDGYYLNESDGCPNILGIWHEEHHCTIPWDEVLAYKHTDFHLTEGMFVDNGQVVDEGEIAKIVIEGEIEWGIDTTRYIEDIGAIQSEMAKHYGEHIRRTAPWILGGNE